MATVKSTSITNLDAGTLVPAGLEEGIIKIARDSLTCGTSDGTGSDYRFFKVHSSWTFVACQLHNGAGGAAGSNLDLGLYSRAGAVVIIDCFIEDQNFDSVVDSGLLIIPLDGTGLTVRRFWEIAAAGTDPDLWYDVCATTNTAVSDTAVTLFCQMWYTTEAIV